VRSGCSVRVNVDAAAGSVALDFVNLGGLSGCPDPGGTGTVPVPNPSGSGDYRESAPDGVDISDGLTVIFDALGRPDSGDSAVVGGHSIVVERDTGYVHQ
ncbi:MAG: hypothetical protein PVF40_00555, partial [Ectothiorhodospiraceae bacterium]